MPEWLEITIIAYIAVIFLMAVIFAVSDKRRAVAHKRRIPEKTLMLVGLFGGALPMYITMKVIHHKTLHKKFMIGLPLEFLLQVILIFLYFYIK